MVDGMGRQVGSYIPVRRPSALNKTALLMVMALTGCLSLPELSAAEALPLGELRCLKTVLFGRQKQRRLLIFAGLVDQRKRMCHPSLLFIMTQKAEHSVCLFVCFSFSSLLFSSPFSMSCNDRNPIGSEENMQMEAGKSGQ